ncbi:MAG: rhomboid family intramembrane serine protease [Crocinitomicaceae bacterium]|nr:rhomboid family intramembrane serine protease [Crocinitomicaceae bacterium]
MYITYLLLAVTILISVMAFNNDALKWKLMYNPYNVVHNNEWYRSFTHAFIHADWTHLIFNMFVLYSFGKPLEDLMRHSYGPKAYLYFSCLYVGGILFSTLLSLRRNKDNIHYNSLGASGAVMAVLFGFVMMMPNAKLMMIFIPIPVSAYIMAPLILAIEYYMSKRGGTGIAHDAHFAGAVFGIIFMIVVDYHLLLDFFSKIGT